MKKILNLFARLTDGQKTDVQNEFKPTSTLSVGDLLKYLLCDVGAAKIKVSYWYYMSGK